ncbi:hypothetical protein BLOT_009224, partial [Blomia tropicalis]
MNGENFARDLQTYCLKMVYENETKMLMHFNSMHCLGQCYRSKDVLDGQWQQEQIQKKRPPLETI